MQWLASLPPPRTPPYRFFQGDFLSVCEPSFSNSGWGPLKVDPPLHETQDRVGLSPFPHDCAQALLVRRVLCLLGWVL